jgi:hypothetical protein
MPLNMQRIGLYDKSLMKPAKQASMPQNKYKSGVYRFHPLTQNLNQ